MQIDNLLFQYYQQNKGILPDGFRACEYLESTGVQWIDTGVNVNAPSIVNIEIMFNTLATNYCFGNVAIYSQAIRCNCGVVNSKIYIGVNDANVFDVAEVDDAFHTVLIDQVNCIAKYDSVEYKSGDFYHASAINRNKLMFAANDYNAPYNNYGVCKIKSAKIDSCRNFLPALALAGTTYTDGNSGEQVTAAADKPGMYDTVSGRFFTNRGTGADFLIGPYIEDTLESAGGGTRLLKIFKIKLYFFCLQQSLDYKEVA